MGVGRLQQKDSPLDRVDAGTGNVDGTVSDLVGLTDLVFANDASFAVGSDDTNHRIDRIDPAMLRSGPPSSGRSS